MRQIVAFLFLIALASTSLLPQTTVHVKVNEVMASNTNTIADPDFNEYGDWVELYNPDSVAVDISGFYLTDIFSQPQKWRFPLSGVIIPANGYLIVWCDDHNTGLHANFKLTTNGEMVGLYSATGALVDTMSFGQQSSDISYGRFPDGENNWYTFFPATPGTQNFESNISGRCPIPDFSIQGGFYSGSVTVSLSSTMSGSEIRYTLDGKDPGPNTPLYTTPIQIDSTTVLRAATFKLQNLPSKPVSNTYFINVTTELPVISLSTDPANFFSDTSGIYVIGTNGITGYCASSPRNWNQDWERPITAEFYEEDKTRAFSVNAGVKIFGGCTRLYAEKSLALYMRDKYGDSKIFYKIFKDSYLYEFNNLVLRNAGQDWYRTMIREGVIVGLVKPHMNVDLQDYRPAVVFLNGKYWGIHNLREKLNEHYIEYHYNVAEEDLDLIEYSKTPDVSTGDSVAYYEMYNFLKNHDLSQEANYEHAKSIIDIDSFIDYHVAEIFAANGDWPANNVKMWRERKPGAKWRWMLYDLDFGYGGNSQGLYTTNTLKHALDSVNTISTNPPWATMIFRRMMNNIEFRNEFIQRMAAHISTTFEINHSLRIIDSVKALVANEIPKHKARWPNSISFGATWDAQVELIREFAQLRPAQMRLFFYDRFNIPSSYSVNLTTNDSTAGKIVAHTKTFPWNTKPVFFKNIPLKIRALPNPGYRFVRWEGFINGGGEKLELLPSANIALKAIFEPYIPANVNLVINEINYKSNSIYDTGDWIEIYNPSNDTLDLTGYRFYDAGEGNLFTLPEGTNINPLGYIAICDDTSKFKFFHPEAKFYTGNFDFGLSSSGETVYIADPAGTVLDSVYFNSTTPWSPQPNGNGYTLSLINPDIDNSRVESWAVGKRLGTPSAINDVYTGIKQISDLPSDYSLSQNFPNPFNPVTKILVTLPERSEIKLKVFDILGNEIRILANGEFEAGGYEFLFNAADLPSGVYIYSLSAGRYNSIKKMVLLK